jgi:hypothetical protein
MIIGSILMGILNMLYSLLHLKKNNTINIIYSYMLFNDQIYYCHNLELLHKYYNKNVFMIINELISRHNDVEFILYHEHNKEKAKISISKIYIIYDDMYNIIEFIGIDSRSKHLINL